MCREQLSPEPEGQQSTVRRRFGTWLRTLFPTTTLPCLCKQIESTGLYPAENSYTYVGKFLLIYSDEVSVISNHRMFDSRHVILLSARKEIEEKGILGLRVAEVAAGANCSITQIYRHFRDRDGLLAQVLGDIYEEILVSTRQAFRDKVFSRDVVTIDDVMSSFPALFTQPAARGTHLRLQILAASVNNQPLRVRLEAITQAELAEWNNGLDELESRLATGEKFDRRVFTMFIANILPYYRMLMGDKGFSPEEFFRFVRDKLTS